MALTKITSNVIAANTLATANIADNSIDSTKIAANSILTRHIDDDQVTGDQLANDITIAGNLTISGNLTTNGSAVTNSSTNTTIEDALLELGTGTSGTPSNDAGIIIERGSAANAFMGYDESADKFIIATTTATGSSTGNLSLTAAPLVIGALTSSGLTYPTSDGSAGQVLKTDGSGALSFGANTSSVANYTATGNGSTTAFNTGTNPVNEVNTWVFLDGVYQQKSNYSYSGSTITFATAPYTGATIDIVTGTTTGIQDSDTVLGLFEATTTNTATYATSLNAANENNTWVFVGGIYQPKDSYTFSTSGSLVFDANTPVGEKLSVVSTKALTASVVTTSFIADDAVTAAKLASNAVVSASIANNTIVGADISATTNITANTFIGNVTGNVTGNIVGNITGALQTAAQTNITSVGTLTSLTSGSVGVTGILTLADTTSDDANKSATFVSRQYNSGTETEGFLMMQTFANSSGNRIDIGGGTSQHNASTAINFFTAGNTTTRTGTNRLALNSTGATFAGNVTTTGEIIGGLFKVGSTTVIDGSRNLTNMGNVNGAAGAFGSLTVDNFTLNNTTLALSGSADMTLDSGGRIILSADDNGEIRLQDGSSIYGQFKDDDDRLRIQAMIADKNILFVGTDGSTEITALNLNMANAGEATFNGGIVAPSANINGQLNVTGTTNGNTISMSQLSTQFDTSSFLRLHPASTTNSGGYTNIFFGTSTSNNFGVAVGGKRAGTNNEPTFAVRMLNDSISGTEVLNINSAGSVRTPYQPFFSVKRSGNQTVAAGSWVTVVWNSETTDTGGNFASNTFTAPISGVYLFTGLIAFNTITATNYVLARIVCNTAGDFYITHQQKSTGQVDYGYDQAISIMISLDANETVSMSVYAASGGNHNLASRSNWQGRLMG